MITTLPMLERIRQQVQSITVLSPRQHSELLATLGSAVDALQAADDAWLQEELQVASTTLKPHCYDPAVRQPFDAISAWCGPATVAPSDNQRQCTGRGRGQRECTRRPPDRRRQLGR